MDVLLSIVVPVYRIEESYLRECLDGLLVADTKNIEIILVDDGSPDNCGEICDEYGQSDGRIRVKHKDNKGVSAARNDGINMANGQYIMFVDADDWVDINQVRSFLQSAILTQSDLVFWGEKVVWPDGRETNRLPFSTNQIFFKKEQLANLQLMTMGREYGSLKRSQNSECMSSVNNKMIKADLIRKFGLRFDETIVHGEDGLFSIELFGVCEQCQYFCATPYHYRQRETSACHTHKENAYDDILQVYNATKQYFDQTSVPDKFYLALNHRCFDWIGWWLSVSKVSTKDDLKVVKGLLESEPMRSVIGSVKMSNFNWKGKIKVLLFRLKCYRIYLLLK